MKMRITPKDMKLGDEILLNDGPYMWATVVRIHDDRVTIFRPFVHVSDFETANGLLHYTGTETFDLYFSRNYEYEVERYESQATRFA